MKEVVTMNRPLAFISAAALVAAVSGCGLFENGNRNNPPPAASAAPEPAPAQTGMSNSATVSGTATIERTSASSDQVRKVQSALKDNGEHVKVDGIWGPRTSQALRDYQQKNGLQASGQLDDQTKQKLNVNPGG